MLSTFPVSLQSHLNSTVCSEVPAVSHLGMHSMPGAALQPLALGKRDRLLVFSSSRICSGAVYDKVLHELNFLDRLLSIGVVPWPKSCV
jgi:hypothetical protein